MKSLLVKLSDILSPPHDPKGFAPLSIRGAILAPGILGAGK